MTKLRIAGSVHPATVEGFRKLLSEANRVAQDGYELVTVVPIDTTHLGCVFRRRSEIEAVPGDSFFE